MWVGGDGLGVELNTQKKSGYITQLLENRPSPGVGMRSFLNLSFYRHSFGCLISFAGFSDLFCGGGVKLDSEFIFPSSRGGFPLDELPPVKTWRIRAQRAPLGLALEVTGSP